MSLLAIAGIDPLLLVGAMLLGLLVILSQLSRKLRGGIGQSRETIALTGQHALHVVEIADRRLLVGTGPSGPPRVLAELGEVESADEQLAARGAIRRVASRRDFRRGQGAETKLYRDTASFWRHRPRRKDQARRGDGLRHGLLATRKLAQPWAELLGRLGGLSGR